MDGKLWAKVYQTVMSLDHPKTKGTTYSDGDIVLVILRASYDERSINWACRPENWQALAGPPRLPSQPTVSRRARTASVRTLLDALQAWLRRQAPDRRRVRAIDGRPLLISPFSKDRDARWGYAFKGLGFGYKLHALWGTGPVPDAWCLRPLNASEATVASQDLVSALPATSRKRYLLGDSSYDTNRLHAVVAARGFQLLAPPKRRGKALGHRPHHPARVQGLRMLKTRYGARLYRQRGLIDRQFGNATFRDEGLGSLPAHVRRLPRVERYVQAKLILNGFRILANRQQLPSLRA